MQSPATQQGKYGHGGEARRGGERGWQVGGRGGKVGCGRSIRQACEGQKGDGMFTTEPGSVQPTVTKTNKGRNEKKTEGEAKNEYAKQTRKSQGDH